MQPRILTIKPHLGKCRVLNVECARSIHGKDLFMEQIIHTISMNSKREKICRISHWWCTLRRVQRVIGYREKIGA